MMKLKNLIQNQGFTLVEVLASLVLLSIILLTFFQLFIFSNKTAVSNNEKLVAVNLAKATLERVKLDPFSYINEPSSSVNYEKKPVTFNQDNCPTNNKTCQTLFSIPINDRTYTISVTASQNTANGEKKLNFITIVIEVQLESSKPAISTKIEGYVTYE